MGMTNEEAKEILSKINIAVSCGATPILLENEIVEATNVAIKALEQALEQARPKGKWIVLDECANEGVYCSECHKKVFKLEFSPTMKWRNFKYCPNCGADMRGDSE